MRNIFGRIAAALTASLLSFGALAQGPGGPGGGPGPAPSPWIVNGPTISYNNGGITLPSSVTGGTQGAGTINVSGGYYVGGVSIAALPCTQCAVKNASNTFLAQQFAQGATTTSPGWYVQLAGDTTPRVRLGLNATDVASVAFGPGNAVRDAFFERAGAANIRFGGPDATVSVPQTLSVQNVLAGTSNTTGGDLTISSSRGTGSAAGGKIIFQISPGGSSGSSQNTLSAGLTITAGGGLLTGAASDPGSGNLNLAGGALYNSGTAPTGTGAYVRSASPTISGTIAGNPAITAPLINGGTHTAITSLGIRSTGSGAFDLTLANTENLTAGRTLTLTLNNAARTLSMGGNITTAVGGDFTIIGGSSVTLTNTGSTSVTLPLTGTLSTLAGSEVFTNKTFTSTTNILGGVTMGIGSDATGDIYYRNPGGQFTRLGIGGGATVLTVSGGLPAWMPPPGGGNVSNTGTPTSGQIAQWTNATTVQGVNLASLVSSGNANIVIGGTTSVTITQQFNSSVLNASPANPATGAGTTPTMMGLGVTTCRFVPTYSTRAEFTIEGVTTNNTGGQSSNLNIRYANNAITAAPANTAAAVGTSLLGNSVSFAGSGAINPTFGFHLSGVASGLTVGATYWFDIVLSASANTASISSLTCTAKEIL